MSPAYGRAVELAREAEAKGASETSKDAHWVTINHRHVLIQAPQGDRAAQTGSVSAHAVGKVPPNSRQDVALIPSGNGKPLANVDMNGFWTFSWAPRELKGDELEPPGNKFTNAQIALSESVNGGPFKGAGVQDGGFRDIISPESRTIVQRFSLSGKRVQVILGRDAAGRLVKAWDVRVTVKYPNAPTYSAAP